MESSEISKEAPLLADRRTSKKINLVTVVSALGHTAIIVAIILLIACAIYGPWWTSWVLNFLMYLLQNLKNPTIRKVYNLLVGLPVALCWGSFLVWLIVLVVCMPWSTQLDNLPKTILLALPWAPIFFPIVILSILSRREIDKPWPGSFVLIRLCWDPPLLIAGYICDTLFQPFTDTPFFDDGKGKMITDMSEQLCQGARPLARHVPELLEHKVHSVINMTSEWSGPVAAYKQAGIEQLQLNITDTFPVTREALEEGVAFAQQRLQQHPDGRVYIHCKGGRARASAMMLCCLVALEGADPHEAFESMSTARPVVEKAIISMRSVQAFVNDASSANASDSWGCSLS